MILTFDRPEKEIVRVGDDDELEFELEEGKGIRGEVRETVPLSKEPG